MYVMEGMKEANLNLVERLGLEGTLNWEFKLLFYSLHLKNRP